MKRNCYVIEAKNGVGLYFSRPMMEKAYRHLSSFDRRKIYYGNYEDAKKYIFDKYGDDEEMDLSKFRVNYTIYRDTSRREYFYVQSPNVIGYGTYSYMKLRFLQFYHVSEAEIIEADSEYEAEFEARNGFVKEYGDPRFYYGATLMPGDAVTFDKIQNAMIL